MLLALETQNDKRLSHFTIMLIYHVYLKEVEKTCLMNNNLLFLYLLCNKRKSELKHHKSEISNETESHGIKTVQPWSKLKSLFKSNKHYESYFTSRYISRNRNARTVNRFCYKR